MVVVRLLVCDFSILTTAPTLCAQTLWHGAAYGMPVDDVKKAVPAAAPPPTNPAHPVDGLRKKLNLIVFLKSSNMCAILGHIMR